MTRAERLAQIRALLGEGLTQRQVAAELGITRSMVKNVLYDPDGSKQSARRRRYQGTCVDCGGPTDGSNGYAKAPKRCAACKTYWTPERIVEAIQAWAEKYGGPPRSTDAGNAGHSRSPELPWFSRVQDVFGTWNAAIEAAGFEPYPPHYTRYRPGKVAA